MSYTFWDTVAGHDFTGVTIPAMNSNIEELVKELKRSNDLKERELNLLEKLNNKETE